jgi:hypothetical protein
MSELILLPSDHVFSYSQINTFAQCRHAFYLEYVLKLKGVENAYAQYGTLAHSLLEQWAKGELSAEDLPGEWERRHDAEVTEPYPPFPKNYREKAYQAGLEYFTDFPGIDEWYSVVATEHRYLTKIGGCEFTGIIDLVLRNSKTGRLHIRDHKSRSLSSMKKDRDAVKQLYAYAKFVKEKYGEYPSIMEFNLFKEGGIIVEFPFVKNQYDDVIQWLETGIALISMESEWKANYQKFFCQNLCSMRNLCAEALSKE